MAVGKRPVVGRFAPTPSGQMHLGNVFAALMAWLAARSENGRFLLRMEDLDTQRTSPAFAQGIREDLIWLGLDWDEETQPQSQRGEVYRHYFQILENTGLVYPCYCTRSLLHSPNAPHLSDGTYVYPGTCRHLSPEERAAQTRAPAWRIQVPEGEIGFTDRVQGPCRYDLARDCGDLVLRRADGVYVYQLAVTVDDALSGVNQVVRGVDLLSSVPRQMYLQQLLGFSQPEYGHIPLLVAPEGRRLSKRDRDLDLALLKTRMDAPTLLGRLSHLAGLLPEPEPMTPEQLLCHFSFGALAKDAIVLERQDIVPLR